MTQQQVNYQDLTLTEDYLYLYQNQPFTGTALETYEGLPLSETRFVNGAQHGLTRRYYPGTKQVFAELDYLNNSLHGFSREWYENGQLKSEARVEYDITLESSAWSEDGLLLESYTLPPDDMMYEIWQLRSSAAD